MLAKSFTMVKKKSLFLVGVLKHFGVSGGVHYKGDGYLVDGNTPKPHPFNYNKVKS